MDLSFFNPKSENFLRFNKKLVQNQENLVQNAIAKGEMDKPAIGDVYYGMNQIGFSTDSSSTTFLQFFNDKITRIQQYRDMASYPEIACAIDMVCDEAITSDANGQMILLNILNDKDMKRSEAARLREEFDIVVNDLFNFRKVGWEIFKKFLVDGEIYFEIILDKTGKNIIALKQLPAFSMTPIFEQGNIVKYAQTDNDGETKYFEENQILYVNFGEYGVNKQDVRGYLDSSIPVYNKLRNLEDAAVIAQIVRAPERRVFNIETGNAPPGKADEIVHQAMQQYRKSLNYDPTTGLIDSSTRFQAMTEDFWFAKREGLGSTVETLATGQQLEQLIELPNYFLRKLYKCLKIPATRWGKGLNGGSDNGNGTYNNKMDIEREELNFTKFIERLQNRFVVLIERAFIMSLTVQGFDPRFLDLTKYQIRMFPNNKYKEFRDSEQMKDMLDMFSQYNDLIMSQENPQGLFSKEFFMRYIAKVPLELIHINDEMKSHEQEELESSGATSDEDEGGMMGGGGGGGLDFGGSDMGGEPGGEAGEEPGGEAPDGEEPGGAPEGGEEQV